MTQVLAFDDLRGSPCTGFNYTRNVHTHPHKFGHNAQNIFHGAVHAARVQIGADGGRVKLILDRRDRLRVIETCSAIAHIKDDTLLLGFPHKGFHRFGGFIHYGLPHVAFKQGVGVGENVACPEVFHKQILEGQGWHTAAKINHDGHIGNSSGSHGMIDGCPGLSLKVSHFEAHHVVFIVERDLSSHLRVHIAGVLLKSATPHSFAHNVQEGQDAGF